MWQINEQGDINFSAGLFFSNSLSAFEIANTVSEPPFSWL